MKIAIITSVFGEYEEINDIPDQLQMQKCQNDVDYFCFTDSHPPKNPKHITFVPDISNQTTNMLRAKYYKVQTHQIPSLKKYDMYIWVDGRIYISEDFIQNILLWKREFIGYHHPLCQTMEQEIKRMGAMVRYQNILPQLQKEITYYKTHLKDKGYTFMGGGIFCRSNSSKMSNIFDKWWCLIKRWSQSYDQFSLSFVLSQFPVKKQIIGGLHDKTNIYHIKPSHKKLL